MLHVHIYTSFIIKQFRFKKKPIGARVLSRYLNMGTSSGAYELNHEYASTSDLVTHTRMSTHILLPR